MTSRPERPLTRDAHAVSLSLPTGLMTPRPVTTTRRVKSGWRMFLSVCAVSLSETGDRGGWLGRVLAVDRGSVGERHGEPVGGSLVVGRDGDRIGRDALDETGQDLARADLDEGADAAGAHGLDRADPVDARREVV